MAPKTEERKPIQDHQRMQESCDALERETNLPAAVVRCCRSLLPLVMVLPLSVQHLPKVRVTFNVIALTDNLPNLTQRTGERGQQPTGPV
jgi:hypothetical protein